MPTQVLNPPIVTDPYTNQIGFSRFDKTWVQTPGFTALAKSGNLPYNPYNVSQDRGLATTMKDKYYTKATGIPGENSPLGLTNGLDNACQDFENTVSARFPTEAGMINELLVQALVSAADVKVNLPVAYVEASKTADLILGTAERLSRAVRSFKRGRFKDVARQLNLPLNTVHKTWLEYQYGWMPLLMDVKGSAELLAQHHFGKPLVFRVRKTRNITHKVTFPGFSTAVRTITATCQTSTTGVSSRTYRVEVDFEVSNQLLDTTRQMGLTNPASVVWELTPFSFVFDWFISVGDYLTALSAFQGLTVRKALSSVKIDNSSVKTIFVAERSSPFYYWYPGKVFVYTTRARFIRSQLSVSPSSIYPPVSADPFNWRRVASGLALIKAQAR